MVARVQESYDSIIIEDCCSILVGEVEGIPPPSYGVRYIVSAMVLAASERMDLVAPATGHPLTVRNEKGHIVSVPCFVSQKERSKSC